MSDRKDHFITSMVRRQVRSETSALEYEIIEMTDTLSRVVMEIAELRNVVLDHLEKLESLKPEKKDNDPFKI